MKPYDLTALRKEQVDAAFRETMDYSPLTASDEAVYRAMEKAWRHAQNYSADPVRFSKVVTAPTIPALPIRVRERWINATLPPPPAGKPVKGPDGKWRTVAPAPVPTPAELAQAHRETMDRISGNERFHEDPFAAAPPADAVFPGLNQCPFCGVLRVGAVCSAAPTHQCPILNPVR